MSDITNREDYVAPAAPAPPAPRSAEQMHSEAEEAMLEALYADLKPDANLMYVNYFLARTPAHLQEDMKDLVEAGLADAPPVMLRGEAGNLGAPTHQRVDVEAVAQAAAQSVGREAAAAAYDAARAAQTFNPGNPNKPMVNVEPGPDGPVIVSAEPAEPPPPPLDQQGELDEHNRTESKPIMPVGEDPLAEPKPEDPVVEPKPVDAPKA